MEATVKQIKEYSNGILRYPCHLVELALDNVEDSGIDEVITELTRGVFKKVDKMDTESEKIIDIYGTTFPLIGTEYTFRIRQNIPNGNAEVILKGPDGVVHEAMSTIERYVEVDNKFKNAMDKLAYNFYNEEELLMLGYMIN